MRPAALRLGAINDPHRPARPRHDPPVLGHAAVALVLAIHHPVLQPVLDPAFLGPAQDLHGALVAAAFPAGEVDAGRVMDEEPAPAFGHGMAPAAGFEALEPAHVVFVPAFAHGPVAEWMPAPVQAVEMAAGPLGPVVPGGGRGGRVSVAGAGEAFRLGPFGPVGPAVGQRGGGPEGAIDGAGQIEAARAGVGGKIVGASGQGVEARAVFLKEGPCAGDGFERAREAQAQPVFVGELQAGAMLITGDGQAGARWEESVVPAKSMRGCRPRDRGGATPATSSLWAGLIRPATGLFGARNLPATPAKPTRGAPAQSRASSLYAVRFPHSFGHRCKQPSRALACSRRREHGLACERGAKLPNKPFGSLLGRPSLLRSKQTGLSKL